MLSFALPNWKPLEAISYSSPVPSSERLSTSSKSKKVKRQFYRYNKNDGGRIWNEHNNINSNCNNNNNSSSSGSGYNNTNCNQKRNFNIKYRELKLQLSWKRFTVRVYWNKCRENGCKTVFCLHVWRRRSEVNKFIFEGINNNNNVNSYNIVILSLRATNCQGRWWWAKTWTATTETVESDMNHCARTIAEKSIG